MQVGALLIPGGIMGLIGILLIPTAFIVSKETAKAMLSGLLNVMSSDYGVAVTGIAGPTGGSKEKPVGTVYIAWGDKEKNYCSRFLIKQPRQGFQKLVTAIAIDLIRRHILQLDTEVILKRWQA